MTPQTSSVSHTALAAQAYALKEENDSLRWQLDAYRNEVELLKQEKEQLFRTEENLTKDQQLQFLQQTMQGMQQVLVLREWISVHLCGGERQPLVGMGEGGERMTRKLSPWQRKAKLGESVENHPWIGNKGQEFGGLKSGI